MNDVTDNRERRARRRGAWAFAASIAGLIGASVFAGAMGRPALERWRGAKPRSAGELAAFLEHAAVDVRLGRGAPLVAPLQAVAKEIKDPAARERVLALVVEAALQAERLDDALAADDAREPLLSDAAARQAVQLQRIGLLGALGRRAEQAALAQPLITGADPQLADEARLRVAATTMDEPQLRAWVAASTTRDPEEARRAGLAALRLLGDAKEARRLLAPLETRDAALLRALLDTYARLDEPREVARAAAALGVLATDEAERARLALVQAQALAKLGDVDGALAALAPIARSSQLDARLAARRARWDVLQSAGRLRAQLASLRDPGERAFVALEVEHDYAGAARWYRQALAARPDSLELAQGLADAERRVALTERRRLYERLAIEDPDDAQARDKLFAVLVALGDREAARRHVERALHDAAPGAALATARTLAHAGLAADAQALLEKTYAAERDPLERQQLLFALGELYAETRRDDDARRVYTSLASGGGSAEIRERAVAQLAPLLR
ncbi:MAG TPA: hypothetical protein VFF06_19465 [Polyangia bacterium]|nr:hypothetical protein [Polyangia bacterium]